MQSTNTLIQLLPEFEFARLGHSYTRPIIWSLWSDGLRLAAPGDPERCRPYSTITVIRLFEEPIRNAESIYHCTLTFLDGQILDFTNFQMMAPGQFERQNAGYRAFVTTLLQQTEVFAPNCQLMGGQKPGLYAIIKVLMLVLMPCFLVYLYAAWQQNNLLHALVNVVLIMTPLMAILCNPPKQLTATDISLILPAS